MHQAIEVEELENGKKEKTRKEVTKTVYNRIAVI